jgi:guanylate kinase
MHNVFHSNATYPILLRRPWNQQATGILAVNTYEEFLKLVEVIVDSYRGGTQRYSLSQPSAVVLVGSTGSGKNEIAKALLERTDCFEKLVSYTTNKNECAQDSENYHYVTTEEFLEMQEANELFESTVYANSYYGSRKSDIEKILEKGKHVLTVMDICGAMSLKTHFSNVITIYIKRDKMEVLKEIVSRDLPIDEKVNRIIAIDSETQNAEICDYIVKVNTYEDAAEQICRGLHIKEKERD